MSSAADSNGNGDTKEQKAINIQIDPDQHSNFSLAQFRIWFPSGTSVKGILAILPGSDCDGRPAADDLKWRELAKRWNFALVGITFTTHSAETPYARAEKGSGEALLKAITQAADTEGHPELMQVPIALVGYSQGGQYAFNFASWRPDRVMSFAAVKGGYYDEARAERARSIPGLLIAGQLDEEFRTANLRRLFEDNNTVDSKWCFAVEPQSGHEPGKSTDLIAPFINAIVSNQISPHLGNLTSHETQPAGAKHDHGGVWLPNGEVAKLWTAFLKGAPIPNLSLQFFNEAPTPIATILPGQLNLGKVGKNAKVPKAAFLVMHNGNEAAWNAIHAYALYGRCQVTVMPHAEGFQVVASPSLELLPFGKSKETIVLRFYLNGQPVAGGTHATVILNHLNENLQVSPEHISIGVHKGICKHQIRIVGSAGKPLKIASALLKTGEAVQLKVAEETSSTATIECTFLPPANEGSHSGTISIRLSEPVQAEILIPFVGAYKTLGGAPD